MLHIAILDDYQNVALEMADWSSLKGHAEIRVFNDHLSNSDEIVQRLLPFEVLCVMRERTPLAREILARLPKLRLIASTGPRNSSIDAAAADEYNIEVMHTRYESSPTIELTWALILASARNLIVETASIRSGGWQRTAGDGIRGKVLGILGLGNIGSEVARIAHAFGLDVIAWSENLAPEKAREHGARWVSKEDLFRHADILTIHLILSNRTRGLVGKAELGLMKPTARLVNASRGPIIDEAALIDALRKRQIAGAAIDVFDIEPLPQDHAFRQLDNVGCDTAYRFRFTRPLPSLLSGHDRQHRHLVAEESSPVAIRRKPMSNRLHWEVFVSTEARVVTSDLPPGATERRWSPISSTLVSGQRDAVLVDTFVTIEQNRTLTELLARAGKNLKTILRHPRPRRPFFRSQHNPRTISERAIRGVTRGHRRHAAAGFERGSRFVLDFALPWPNRCEPCDCGGTCRRRY
jgi:phosphoglycerate dehydrogenase-like enzyme